MSYLGGVAFLADTGNVGVCVSYHTSPVRSCHISCSWDAFIEFNAVVISYVLLYSTLLNCSLQTVSVQLRCDIFFSLIHLVI